MQYHAYNIFLLSFEIFQNTFCTVQKQFKTSMAVGIVRVVKLIRFQYEQLDGECHTSGGKNSLVTICNVDLENVGQGHKVRLLQ